MTGEGTILKTDTKGRVHTPRQRRESLLEEFERSGLSAAKFAELTGLKYQTFAGWVARRRKQRALPPSAPVMEPVRWLEAVVRETQCAASSLGPVKVRLPNEVCLEVSDLQQVGLVAALVRALNQASSRC